jgi:hypothetical protein
VGHSGVLGVYVMLTVHSGHSKKLKQVEPSRRKIIFYIAHTCRTLRSSSKKYRICLKLSIGVLFASFGSEMTKLRGFVQDVRTDGWFSRQTAGYIHTACCKYRCILVDTHVSFPKRLLTCPTELKWLRYVILKDSAIGAADGGFNTM